MCKMWMQLVVAILLGLVASPQARAALSDDVVTTAGSGPNVSYVVVDFGQSETEDLEWVFAVRYTSPTLTSEEALNLLTADTDLVTTFTNYGFGNFLSQMAFTHEGHHWENPDSAYWMLSDSDDGGITWSSSMLGMGDHVLQPGHADGWQAASDFSVPTLPNGPRLSELQTRYEDSITTWVGTGENHAYLSLDFNASTTDSLELHFGVRFSSPTITSEEALSILEAGSDLLTTTSDFGFGAFVNALSYDYRGVQYKADPQSAFWILHTSNVFGDRYNLSAVGMSDRVLEPGDTDGWQAQLNYGATVPNGPTLADYHRAMEADVKEWAGAGSNTAFVVVDFSPSPTESGELVFGVRFTSATITSEEALNLIAAETDLVMDAGYWPGLGMFINNFTYDMGNHYRLTKPAGAYWSLFTSPVYGDRWISSMIGASARTLEDGDCDGWLANPNWDGTTPNGPRDFAIPALNAGNWNLYQ